MDPERYVAVLRAIFESGARRARPRLVADSKLRTDDLVGENKPQSCLLELQENLFEGPSFGWVGSRISGRSGGEEDETGEERDGGSSDDGGKIFQR